MSTIKMINFDNIKEIASVLSNDARIEILRLVLVQDRSLQEISEVLKMPLSTVTLNVKMLEEAGLVRCEMYPAKRGLKKICSKSVGRLIFDLANSAEEINSNAIIIDMPVGRFCDFQVVPVCGMASSTGIISYVDDPVSFYDPNAVDAQLIWFSQGYLEYRFPNRLVSKVEVTSFEISLELCSEAPGYNPDWPSDIFLEINGVDIGTFTSAGDFGGTPGLLTPAWWDGALTQYGQHKRWVVTKNGNYIDGVKMGNLVVDDLKLNESKHIKMRIGIREDAKNIGGINIFGHGFGNHDQDIRMKIDYITT